jgi:hypothetical protein
MDHHDLRSFASAVPAIAGASQKAERILRVALPFGGGLKGIRRRRVPADPRKAHQRLILSADVLVAPLRPRVHTDPAEGVDDGPRFSQHDRIVPVEVDDTARCQIRHGKDLRIRIGTQHDEDSLRGKAPGERDALGRHGAAVAVELQRIRREVDGFAGRIVKLDRFVVGTAFDIFGDQEIAAGSGQGSGVTVEQQSCGESTHGIPLYQTHPILLAPHNSFDTKTTFFGKVVTVISVQ